MEINLFTEEILYCLGNPNECNDFEVSNLANHFRTKNNYIFNCFTYYCPIYRSFTKMPMILSLIKFIPDDKKTDENSKIYDNAFIYGYYADLKSVFNTEKANKELIHKTATKSFLGFYIDEIVFGKHFFEKIGKDVGKRYKAWEIITQTPDEFADYFDKDTDANNKKQPQQIALQFTHKFTDTQRQNLFNGLVKGNFISKDTNITHFNFVFGGAETADFNSILWLKDNQDLKIFIDTFFPNEKRKWKKTVACFMDNQSKEINYNSIRNLNPAYKDNPPSEAYFKKLKNEI